MDYVLAEKTSPELEELYWELKKADYLCDEDKDTLQNIKGILYRRGWRF